MHELTTDALATYRLTKVVIDDEITDELREKAFGFLDQYPDSKVANKAAYFLTCPWCVSVWAGAGIRLLRITNPVAAEIISGTLAVSALTGILYSRV